MLLGLGVLVTQAEAVRVPYAWEFPLADWPAARFTLRVTGIEGPRATVRQVPISPLTTQACQARHTPCPPPIPGVQATPEACIYTADTVCADVCLEPGHWTLEVLAHDGGVFHGPTFVSTAPTTPLQGTEGGVSAASNPLDVQIEAWVPPGDCPVGTPPPTPVPPNPPPPPERVVVPVPTPPQPPGRDEGPRDPWSLVNLQCVHWKVLGPCYCNPFSQCFLTEYFEPAYLIETVKIPGDTWLIGLVGNVLGLLPTSRLGGGGAGQGSGSTGGRNLHYNEVHVFKFPQMLGGPCSQGSSETTLYYASEIDLPMWRTATGAGHTNVGTWGKLYPRQGHAITGSEPVASGLAAVRGVDIAVNPVGSAVPPDAHITLQKAQGACNCYQLAAPKQTMCMPPGTNPARWEQGTGSKTGRFLWIGWQKRQCCVDQITSGITILGGYGSNQCELAPPTTAQQ